MKRYCLWYCLFMLFLVLSASCDWKEKEHALFRLKENSATQVAFSNIITENDSVNILDYYYCYNGGGVAVADFDNDSLPDLFFSGNMVSSRLYLNQGSLSFKDITQAAGLATRDWIMGASVVDINADGWQDLYLSVAGPENQDSYQNLLFVNQGANEQGVPEFKEMAAAYGLADSSFSVQSAFLDYDRDGDLDMFLLTNHVDFVDKSYIHPKSYPVTNGLTRDRLYENTGMADSLGHPYFVDVSEKAGILYEGYSLGVSVDDLNADGWPDIYVACDFMPNDLIYLNRKDGTFQEVAVQSQQHQSYNGMGVDIADLNADLLPDIMVLDMLPRNNERRKTMRAGMNFERFAMEAEAGYVPQFMRNTLQLNRGVDRQGMPLFSDISQLAGVHDTDWSWSVLLADFDNDSRRDIYVTNGFVKDITDLDFANYSAVATVFGTQESKMKKQRELTRQLHGIKVPNYLFHNEGTLSFKDKSQAWGVAHPSFSNGAAYTDLDMDGDLDLVVSNINDPAFIYENTSNEREHPSHFLKVQLQGKYPNTSGVGTRIVVYQQQQPQYYYHNPARGYLSSMQEPVHFGLGASPAVDSLEVYWPDGSYQKLKNIQGDRKLLLQQQQAQERQQQVPSSQPAMFHPVQKAYGLTYRHEENHYNDFNFDPMLPAMYSRGGPAVAVGDVDGRNGDDVIVGGAAGFASTLFLQQEDGTFAESRLNEGEARQEDMGSLLFDADQDGDIDLYVVSGGSEFVADAQEYQDRLYLNDGSGSFRLSAQALPEIRASGSCVVGADYDQDGDIDLFVGGRFQPGAYPTAPRSYLLENQGGTFTDITQQQELGELGMVHTALWTDFDNDGWTDLIVAGEWMPITFFHNRQGQLVNVTERTGLEHMHGWWNSMYAVDIDHDGDMDYVAGNMGTNIDYKPTPQHPVQLFARDYDENGKIDPILSHYLPNAENEPELFPFHGRDDLFKQLIGLKKHFKNYESYAYASLTEVIPEQELEESQQWKAETFASCILVNQGEGKFAMQKLPVEAQFSAVYGILARDFNRDGHADLLLSGNSHTREVLYGWQDASLGLLILGDGKGGFAAVSPQQSGLFLHGDTKGLASLITAKGTQLLLSAVNADSLQVLALRQQQAEKTVRAEPMDACAILHTADGRQHRHEFHYGAGYLSQSSRVLQVPEDVVQIEMVDFQGRKRVLTY